MANRSAGMNDVEAEARAINAEPWDPMPGMVKKRCSRCFYFFAVLIEEAETTSRCPDCVALGAKWAISAAPVG